ncbi:hypothetical protein QR680_013869 [Steinernema hermaphroditum]|uniref:Uncharacterized protein n=1 Tax=Steinernema hermaphroditum TaxID=289476 RepID=A0AA39M2Z6_9BILA|nr:hypothetical protein QR680_013869 [Steinernema hermaphroditum]
MPINFTVAELKKLIGPRKELNLNAKGINYLDDADVEKLAQLNNSVERLDLSDNRLDSIPESLCTKLNGLVALDVRANNLTMLPANIGKMSRLKYLDAYGNDLTDLPNSLSKLSYLSHLELANNRFDGALKEFMNKDENEVLPPQKFAAKLRAFLEERARAQNADKQKQEKTRQTAAPSVVTEQLTARNGKKAKNKVKKQQKAAEPEHAYSSDSSTAPVMGFVKDVMKISLIMAFVVATFAGYAFYRNCTDKQRYLANTAGFCADATKLVKKGEISDTLWKNTNAAGQQLFIVSMNEAIKFKNYAASSQFGHAVQSYAQRAWTYTVDILLKARQFLANLLAHVVDWYDHEGQQIFGEFVERAKVAGKIALEVFRDVSKFVYAKAVDVAHWVYDASLLLVNDSEKFIEKVQKLYS